MTDYDSHLGKTWNDWYDNLKSDVTGIGNHVFNTVILNTTEKDHSTLGMTGRTLVLLV